jgi:serine protease inhibitor
VTYLVPKKTEDNIFELTKDANIFEEKEDDKVYATKGGRHSSYDEFMVHLKTPKFKLKCDVDFRECLEGLGFESVFDRKIDSFKNAFSGDNLDNMNFYLQQVKQRNEVEFNEDGSVVKSVSMAVVGGVATAAPNEPAGTLEVDLNQPFIYIIKDVNDTPVFVGHVDNPNA